MFSQEDINNRSVVLINAIITEHRLKMVAGNFAITNAQTDEVITKLNKQKVFAFFLIGNITLTNVVIRECAAYGISICLMNQNFRTYAFMGDHAAGNYLLRQKQHQSQPSLTIAKHLIKNKVKNQCDLIASLRQKNIGQQQAVEQLKIYLSQIDTVSRNDQLMGVEGNAAKLFFKAWFGHIKWQGRKPQAKIDPINTVLDIGYTMLFNLMESFLRLFGFDLYVGNLHQLWFERKSLVCDLVEPFRVIVDKTVRTGFNLNQFKPQDFKQTKCQYILKHEHAKAYCEILAASLIEYKKQMFIFVQMYYRAFMGMKSVGQYPHFYME